MKIIFFRADGKLLASSTLGVSVAEAEDTFGRVFGRLDGDREAEEVLAVVGRPGVKARKIGVIIRGAILLPLARRECPGARPDEDVDHTEFSVFVKKAVDVDVLGIVARGTALAKARNAVNSILCLLTRGGCLGNILSALAPAEGEIGHTYYLALIY